MSKILVVDDSELDRKLATQILSLDDSFEIETAKGGLAALTRMAENDIDLVVTDLQMPEMDGIQLVLNVKSDFPDVPVILMTGHGSETIAIEALTNGAANYVPKSQLKNRLVPTVREALGAINAEGAHRELLQAMTKVGFELNLTNEPKLINALVTQIEEIASGVGLGSPNNVVRLGVVLREAIVHALNNNRVIGFRFKIDQKRCKFVLSTIEGDSTIFNPDELPAQGDLSAFESKQSHGFFLMKSHLDSVNVSEDGKEAEFMLETSL